jgi:hypothetical protein
VPCRCVGARAHRCSLATVEEDEAVPEGCSPKHEQGHDGGEDWRRLELNVRVKEGVRELRREGKSGGEVRRCSSHFIGPGGRWRWLG